MANNNDPFRLRQLTKRRKLLPRETTLTSREDAMDSFSRLPLETREAIANYLPYRGILALCNVESGLTQVCNDPDFWRGLIKQRFPDFQGDPDITQDPKGLFRRLETMYSITIIPYHGSPLSFMTGKERILAASIIGVRISSFFFLHDHLIINKPGNRGRLGWPEMKEIERKYKPEAQTIEGILQIYPDADIVEVNYFIDGGEKRMYLINTDQDMLEHLKLVMTAFDAKDITMTRI